MPLWMITDPTKPLPSIHTFVSISMYRDRGGEKETQIDRQTDRERDRHADVDVNVSPPRFSLIRMPRSHRPGEQGRVLK